MQVGCWLPSGLAPKLYQLRHSWGPQQNENTALLVQKLLRISIWCQIADVALLNMGSCASAQLTWPRRHSYPRGGRRERETQPAASESQRMCAPRQDGSLAARALLFQ